MFKSKVTLLRLFCIALCFEKILAENDNITTTTAGTTLEPKVNIVESTICKKCSCNTEIKEIDCSRNLTSWFSAEEWKTLQNGDVMFDTIILQYNNFTSVPAFPAYPVKNLYLGFNQIKTIAIAAFQNLTKLTRLDLSHNQLNASTLTADIFKGLYNIHDDLPLGILKDLNLSHNEIHLLGPDVFVHIPHLENLTLSQNVMNGIGSSTEIAITYLLELKLLDISYMELKEIPPSIFHSLKKLETIILAGNLLKTLPEGLNYADNLKYLNIDDNPIVTLSEKNVFPLMPNLKILSISFMGDLVSFGNGSFSNLQKLSTLYASDNERLTYIEDHAFSNDSINIKEVYFNNNNLSSVSHFWFTKWEQIEIIDLRFNPWDCVCSNEWLVDFLIPKINKTTPHLLENVQCASPPELKNSSLLKIASSNSDSLCNSSTHIALACIIVIVLVIMPLAIASVVLYRRGCFGLRNRYNRRNERALYSRATFTDDFHI